MGRTCLVTAGMTPVTFFTSFVTPCCSEDPREDSLCPTRRYAKSVSPATEVHALSCLHTILQLTPGNALLREFPFPTQSFSPISAQQWSKSSSTLLLFFSPLPDLSIRDALSCLCLIWALLNFLISEWGYREVILGWEWGTSRPCETLRRTSNHIQYSYLFSCKDELYNIYLQIGRISCRKGFLWRQTWFPYKVKGSDCKGSWQRNGGGRTILVCLLG